MCDLCKIKQVVSTDKPVLTITIAANFQGEKRVTGVSPKMNVQSLLIQTAGRFWPIFNPDIP